MPISPEELSELINQKIESLRPRLLDLSRRNPLISTKLTSRSNSHIRAVDELPDVLFFNLCNNQEMRIIPLPSLEDDPKDEDTSAFRRALANARLTDPDYLNATEKVDDSTEDYLDLSRKLERTLKDKVRQQLGLAARPQKQEINIAQHARNNGISPSYDLPDAANVETKERHTDSNIQTLLLPKDLERKLSALNSKCNTWIQETGINVLHCAFGFLEWSEPNATETSFAPLILLQVKFEKKKTKDGHEFWVSGLGEEADVNTVLSEKLRLEFGIQLPAFTSGSVETYLKEVASLSPKAVTWRVRRQVAFGVFPSARMAMYHDLNTQSADFGANDIIRPIFGGSGSVAASPFADEYIIDEPEIERLVPSLVLDADASQFSTLVDIATGKNVAVEGPPGTGKSQTIVNAIAAALANGKKVLFVAEKMAALDVVRSRLEAIGLGEYLLPLQAERSTREKVIQSIRDRLEMGSVQPPRYYDDQIAQFRAARDETAEYIKILSSMFEDSGLTIYELIGKSIATGHRLESLPKALQLAPFPLRERLTAATIKELVNKSSQLEQAWERAANAAPFWTGMGNGAINRFDAEEIFETAENLAQWLEYLDEKLQRAGALGLSELKLPAALPALASIFEAAGAVQNPSHLSLLPALQKDGLVDALALFLNDCRNCSRNHEDLSALIQAEITEATLDIISELEAICNQHEIDDLDVETLVRGLAFKRQTIIAARKLASQMRPFADQVPGSEHWRFSDIERIRNITARVGRDVLHGRNPIVAEPAAPPVLKKLNEKGRELQRELNELSEHFSLDDTISIEQLAECTATLKSSGSFRLLSSDYRRAKKLYRRLGKNKYQRDQAIPLLERLIGGKRREAEFSRDPQSAALYGLHFRGIETDFDFFDRVADFYISVRETFATIDQKPVRDFLLTSDVEIILEVPALDAYPDAVRLKAIEDGVSRFEADAATREQACNRVRELAKIFTPSKKVETNTLAGLKDRVSEHLRETRRLDSHGQMSSLLGAHFAGSRTDTEALEATASLAKSIITLSGRGGGVASLISTGEAEAGALLVRELDEAFSSSDTLAKALDAKARLTVNSILKVGTLADRARALHGAAQDQDGLYAHAEFAAIRTELAPALNDTIDAYVAAKGDYSGLSQVLDALAFRALTRRAYERHGTVLAKYPGSKLNDLRKRVAKLDKQIIEASRTVLKAMIKATAKPPRGNGTGKKGSWTELALIENETGKKTKFIPVRDLTRRAGAALLELKPCWMMSPLAVAQYLQKGLLSFDLCIIDEASQMTPEDSVGALVRSRQAMIVGDTNQLPPSSFFRKMIDDADADEDETVLNESILEMANATFRPARRLRWHYRSRHSGLIKFSNRLVYNDDLVVFPSATEEMAGMGIAFRAIPGLYKSGTNAIEVREMVEAAIRFMKEDPDRSLGIVTLNQKQRDLIFEEMEFALSQDPSAARYVEDWTERNDGLEQFFIKNLENVQGDERDVIFIGTVYGPEETGARVMQRFGPINGVAGKRRLNVLFSRAKQQIVTFSSMRSSDIAAEENGNEGAYMLKRWLEYCATGTLDAGELTYREPDSDFELFVIEQIKTMGCIPVPQVGVKGYSIDIGVKHPQWAYGFILGVECDGASFHSTKSARDRDRLRQEVLEGLGWRFHRIWSTDWFNNPAKQAAILRDVITARLAELKAQEAKFSCPATTKLASINGTPPSVHAKVAPDPQPHEPPKIATVTNGASNKRVSIGDTVRVRYLTDDKHIVQFTISAERSDPSSGIIHCKKPIAEALLGAEEGDEVEILVGSYLRPAVLEKIVNRLL